MGQNNWLLGRVTCWLARGGSHSHRVLWVLLGVEMRYVLNNGGRWSSRDRGEIGIAVCLVHGRPLRPNAKLRTTAWCVRRAFDSARIVTIEVRRSLGLS